ncbi:MAG: phytanoyl-CoA dioxygenase family protein [Planctomycetota bacterium]|nr:phytanoyl-CoA dioxygenase family protein [Planctomycetota bacterium]MDA1142152.1 phytanoyl-CoA dioxygenase family protein [Planctomycetota bacterium]
MNTQAAISQIIEDGYSVVDGIIPGDRVGAVRDEIIEVQQRNHERTEAEFAKIRARGHRIGAKGVAALRQVINETQCFAPWIADRKIMEVVEAFFGPHSRISCTDCVLNHPGNERGYWHADWPYNQTNASHIPTPYPDALLHLSTIWMLTRFSAESGGTLILPGSHRRLENPSDGNLDGVDRDSPHPDEIQVEGSAGSVLLYDSRLWHAVAPNESSESRVALIIRYAPWWLNLNPTIKGKPEHDAIVVETGGKNYEMEPLRREVFDGLPDEVKPLYRHCVLK